MGSKWEEGRAKPKLISLNTDPSAHLKDRLSGWTKKPNLHATRKSHIHHMKPKG